MNPSNPIYRAFLRGIISCYLLLFLTALVCTVYLLQGVIQIKPMAAIGLAKYVLLCILFAILSIHAIKALSLKNSAIKRFVGGIKNFKWLFTITSFIALLARFGIFDKSAGKQIEISCLQIGILLLLTLFCFWTERLLKPAEENQKEGSQDQEITYGTGEDS